MNLVMVGINFKTAPLEVRERMSFKNTEIPKILRCLKRLIPDIEVVLLSTCNRTELYAAGADLGSYKDSLSLIFAKGGDLWSGESYERYLYRRENLEAVTHLFTVASSLDSMVVGEREILGQVKTAYACGLEAGTTGRVLNPLFQRTLKAAKQIQTETAICQGHVSVSSIAVEFAETIFTDLATKTVIIVGSGEMSELTLRNLVEKGVHKILVLNRSPERGKALADQYGGKAIPFDLLDEFLPQADIVISSTNAPKCVIHAATVHKAVLARRMRPMLLIDIAVPRDIEEAAGDLENVYLYNIDDLQEIAAENLATRQAAVESARAIIHQHAAAFADWFQAQSFGTLIHQIEQAAGRIRDVELTRAFSRQALANLPETSREEIRALVNRMINRILSAPKIALREAARNGHGETYSKIVRHLCGLERRESNDEEK